MSAGVTDMNQMFAYANQFNQNIGSWNVSSVTTMSEMFLNATKFKQDLSSWNVNGVTNWDTISGDVFAGRGWEVM